MTLSGRQKVVTERRTLKSFRTCLCSIYIRTMKCPSNMGGRFTYCTAAYDIPYYLQRRIAGLHQNTSIGSTDITDLWEPLEEGLLP